MEKNSRILQTGMLGDGQVRHYRAWEMAKLPRLSRPRTIVTGLRIPPYAQPKPADLLVSSNRGFRGLINVFRDR